MKTVDIYTLRRRSNLDELNIRLVFFCTNSCSKDFFKNEYIINTINFSPK